MPKIKKKRYILYALFIAIYSSFAMNLSIYQTDVSKVITKFSTKSMLNYLIASFEVSSSGQTDGHIFYEITAIAIGCLFLFIFAHQYKIREVVGYSLLSVVFSFCMWVGAVYSREESWNRFIANKYFVVKNIVYCSGYFLLFLGVCLVASVIIKENFSDVSSTGNKPLKKILMSCMLVLIVCWLPYYFIFWPGVIHGDTPMQILQIFHYPTQLVGTWRTDGIDIVYSNDHSFFQTILLNLFMKLGFQVHNNAIGWGLYSLLTMLALIGSFSALITTLYRFHVNHTVLKGLLLVYALVPIFPMYAMLIGGDTFLSLMFVIFMIFVIWLFGTRGEILSSWKFDVGLAVSIFLLGASKNQGIYIAAFFFLVVLVWYYKKWKRVLISMLLPILFFQIVYTGIFFDAMHVGSTGKQDAMGAIMQQTARYVKYHGDEVTEEEKEVINKIFDYDRLAEVYDYNLCDPVKCTFKQDATSEEMSDYMKVWFKMGLKHPGEYVQSLLSNTYGYYYPELTYKKRVFYTNTSSVRKYVEKREWIKELVPESLLEKTDFESPACMKGIREKVTRLLMVSQTVPILDWLYIPGCITWLMLIGFVVFWVKKDYNSIILYIPVFLVLGVCLLSPKNANLRYILPNCMIVPAMLASAFGGFQTEQENGKKS